MTPESPPSAGKRSDPAEGCGIGLFILFLAQIVLGIWLETRFRATAGTAYADVLAIQTGSASIIRGFHYWGSAVLIVGSLGLLTWFALKGRFKGEDTRLWLGTIFLFLASLFSQLSGNVLPFDRHGVQTAVVETGVARQMPIMGSAVSKVILAGDRFNDDTVARWHLGHIGFCVLGLLAGWLIWSSAKGRKWPRVVTWAPVGLAAIFALMAPAPLGNPATAVDYGSFDAQVSWYTWPMHGSLKLFSQLSPSAEWLGSGLLPGILIFLLLTAPFTSKKLPSKVLQVAFASLAIYFLVAALFFGGRFAALTGNRDPAIAIAKTPVTTGFDQALYDKGRALFNSNACIGCHGKDGRNATQGPDLIAVAQRRGGDPAWYMKFIHNPSQVKPNSTMPPFPQLTDTETRAIAEFLIHQK